MKKHIVIALAVVSIILGFVISCEEPQVNLPTQYTTPTIKGTLSIPTSQNVSASEVFVKVIDSDGNTVTVQKANADGSFVVQNLNAGKKYSVLFTSVEPEFTNRAVGGSSGVGGWLYDVVPAVQEGNNVGNVKLKPLGTIKGKALIDGESEHYDITVYIPGTSYIAKTDKDGSFSIYNVPEGKYTLRYTLDDHLPVMVKDVMLVCPEDVEKPEVKVKKVTLKSSLGSVEGRAILGDSNDSTGVKVNLESEDKSLTYPAFTSKDGYYTISGIQPGIYRVIVSYEGYTSQMSSYFSVTSGTLTKIDTLIELYSTSGFLKGSVSLNDSDTKSDIAVTIRNMEDGNTFTVITDVNGDFSKRLKPGTYTVYFSHSGYSSYSVEATVVENNTTTLSPVILYSVYGTITGSSFSPEETVTILDDTGSPIQTLQSSNDCTFKFSGIKSGTYSIRFSKTGFSSNTISDVIVTPSKTTTINGVELKSLYGTLKGVAGSEGDSVSLMKGGVVVETVTVNSSRRYSFTGIEPGNYSVRFSREGYTPYESETVAVAAAAETTIDGKVLISIYGTIVGTSYSENETVSLIKDGTVLKTVVTTEDRSYSFTSVDPGIYKIRFSKDRYTSYEREEVTVLAGIETAVNGKALVSIYGTIKGISASEGETVYLVRNGVQIQSATTLESRGYIFSEIEPGEYSVRFTKNGYKAYESEAITVKAGESHVVDGQKLVSMYGAVAGFVFLSGSDDYSGVTVTLTSNESMTSSFVETTASDGSFRFSDIRESGTYLLTYSKDGYVTENTKSVDVTIGSVANAGSVTLKSTYATVKGTIQLEGASSYENVTILLKNENNQYTSTTDQKGGYVINRVLPGTYTLLASKEGYVTSTPVEVVIEPSSEKAVETKSLAVAIRSVTGRVTLELLSDYSGALVTATNLSDNTLVYSAITNSSGAFTLAGMKPGEYSIVISCNGYRSVTLPTINIVSSSTTNLSATNMLINRGTVSGTVTLEGKSTSYGIKIELLRGSEVYAESTTDESGNYSFYVPQGNYSGVRYSKTDFASVSVSRNIALFADNYVSVGDTTLSATHNTISGTVDVLTTDNEGDVTISFDGVASIPAVTTSESGEFTFEHIPVGSYVMRFSRTNCSDITVPVEVKAADLINLGTVTITPNTATIKGTVILKDGLSSSGVTVSVDMGDGMVLSTITDNSGRYELGGISVAGEYIVSYSKNGWKSDSQIITPKLSALEERELQDIILVDNIAPTISNVVINEGSTFTDNPKLNLKLFAQDEGSGIDSYSIQIKKRVDGVESSIFPVNYLWQSFEQNVVFDLAQLPNSVYTGNGTYVLIVAVKDKTGNISTPINNEVIITNNATSLTGQLRGEYLHLTKNRSPYVIEGNCTVGPDDTLIIDPGCEIRFAGDYSLYIAGKINAVGSDEERIVFTKSDDFNGRWKTVAILGPDAVINNTVEYEEGSIVQNCDFEYAEVPLALSCAVFVDSCSFQNSGKLKITANPTIINSYLENGVSIDNSGHGVASLINNIIEESLTYGYTNVVHLEFNTIKNANVFIETGYYDKNWIFAHNKLIKSTMKFEQYLNTEYCSLNNNSFEECEGLFITCNLSSHDYNNVDFSQNYWGAARTEEIIAKGNFSDLSFIYDWFDDSKQPRVNYDNWLEEEPAIVGYQGDSFDWTLIK